MNFTLKVKPNSCELHKEFSKRNFTQGCYAAYTIDKEDQASFGNNSLNIFTSNAYVLIFYLIYFSNIYISSWHYTSAELTKTSLYTGVVSEYGGGGYIQLFTRKY